MYYIVVENEVIIASHIANGARPNNETAISKTQFDKIKNTEGKIYKYISKKIVEEDGPVDIEARKLDLISIANKECQAAIFAGFDFEGDIFQLEEKDQNNYNSLMVLKSYLPTPIRFTLQNKKKKLVPSSKVEALSLAAFVHKSAKILECQEKTDLINACTTIEELEAL